MLPPTTLGLVADPSVVDSSAEAVGANVRDVPRGALLEEDVGEAMEQSLVALGCAFGVQFSVTVDDRDVRGNEVHRVDRVCVYLFNSRENNII